MSRRDFQLPPVDVPLHLHPPSTADAGIGIGGSGKFVAKLVCVTGNVQRKRFPLQLSIEIDQTIMQVEFIPGRSNHSLDQVHGGINWIVEHENIVTFDGFIGQQRVPGAGVRKNYFIHQQKIANQQRFFHRSRRNPIGLSDKCQHK